MFIRCTPFPSIIFVLPVTLFVFFELASLPSLIVVPLSLVLLSCSILRLLFILIIKNITQRTGHRTQVGGTLFFYRSIINQSNNQKGRKEEKEGRKKRRKEEKEEGRKGKEDTMKQYSSSINFNIFKIQYNKEEEGI